MPSSVRCAWSSWAWWRSAEVLENRPSWASEMGRRLCGLSEKRSEGPNQEQDTRKTRKERRRQLYKPLAKIVM